MKEIKNIIRFYDQIDFSESKAALNVVVRVEGSSYRRTGARMLVLDNGEWVGGISGGCLEGDALKKAKLSLYKNEPVKVTYDTTQDEDNEIGVGLGCNGIIDVLSIPLDPVDELNPVHLLRNRIKRRTPSILITIVDGKTSDPDYRAGRTLPLELIDQQERVTWDTVKSELLVAAKEVLDQLKSKTIVLEVEKQPVVFFVECIKPSLNVFVYGGNYDVIPVVEIGRTLGWNMTVCTQSRKIMEILHEMEIHMIPDRYADIPIDRFTAALVMSHDFDTDQQNLSNLLKTKIPYIGLLGPHKRGNRIFNNLHAQLKPEDHLRIFNPVGLDIGAQSPEEIAVSIISEIIAVLHNREGTSLKKRKKPIYG